VGPYARVMKGEKKSMEEKKKKTKSSYRSGIKLRGRKWDKKNQTLLIRASVRETTLQQTTLWDIR